MFNKTLILSTPGVNDYSVRTIVEDDIKLLRGWKNANRDSFFFKDVITPEMQREWFKSYLQRDLDFMLVIVHKDERVGCIGFRRLVDRVDLYNLILGRTQSAGKGHMARALDLVCEEAKKLFPKVPIMVSVLRKNPALQWYFRRGFKVTKEHETYLELSREN